MGLFDFLKKKEFKEIQLLKQQIEKEILKVKESNSKLEEFSAISDIQQEVENKTKEFNELSEKQSSKISKTQSELSELGTKYETSLETYTKLRKEVSLYESKLDLIEFGVYDPIYDFEQSDDYRTEQKRVIQLQKDMIQDETAAVCPTNWTVDGSEAKGRASTKRNIKLVLRAFNGECNSLIAKVKWNNVNQMQERIKKSFEAINKLGKSSTISIEEEYLDLKIKELVLEHEFTLKRQREKEEKNYQSALDKARKEIADLTGDKHDKLQAQIEKLELELKESQEKKERAMSMAQQTKRGHVYVISNIGSFGENVYKIGMTRRLEPTDRVKELGDASVPFRFDIHAMMYSDDAPNLEKELHRAFEEKKVNMLNYRKEFFNVTLDEIESQIKETGIEAEFTKLPEAIEYRETLAILQKMNDPDSQKTVEQEIEDECPSSLN